LDFVTSWGPALGDKAAAMISLGLGWSDQNLALKNLGLGLRAQNPRDSSTSVGDQRNSGKENHGTHELSQPALRNADKPERKGTPENANEARNTVNQEGGSTAPRTQKNSKVPDQKVNYGDMTIFRSNRSSLQSDRDSLPRGWIGTRDHFGYDAGQGEDHAMHVNFHEHLYVDPPDTRAVRA
jgi:hypothetical protein